MNESKHRTSRTNLKMFPESDSLCTSSDYCKILLYIFPTATIHLLYLSQLYSL